MATSLLRRFNIAHANAEKVGNVYSILERVDFLLTAMEPCKKPAYRLILTLVQSKRNKGDEDVDYTTFGQDFITVDEKDELIAKKNRQTARGLNAALTFDSKPVTKANAAESDNKPKASYPPRDMSKVDCHNCGKFGHFSRDCRLPRKDKKAFNTNVSRSDRNRKRGNRN